MHDKMMWTNESIQFTFHSHVQEYDMQAASVSICELFGLLPKEVITELKLMPKEKRTVKMGLFQREDKQFSDNLLAGIREVRKKFIEVNNLSTDEILSLHSDACILNTNKNITSNIDGVTFRKKNEWNAYIRYNSIEMFYKNDIKNNYIDYKNVPEQLVGEQMLGFDIYLKKVFEYIENYDDTVLKYISKFQKKYLQNQLPDAYYHTFGKYGKYKFDNLKLTSFIAQVAMKEVKSWQYQMKK